MFAKIALEGKNGMVRSVLLLAVVFLGFVVGQIPLILLLDYTRDLTYPEWEEIALLVLLLLGYLGGMAALLLSYRKIHHRSARSLISKHSSIDFSRIGWAFLIWFLLMTLAEGILYFMDPPNYLLQFDATSFILLILVSFVLIPIQTSFEELVFRGYLIQQFSLLFNSRITGVALSAVIFGLMHLANPEVAAFGLFSMMLYYISFGLFAGFCTIIDGRLELVLGIHAATNIYSAIVVTFESSVLQTPAIFKVMNLDVPATFCVFVLSGIIFFYLASRKYQWSGRSALIDRIK